MWRQLSLAALAILALGAGILLLGIPSASASSPAAATGSCSAHYHPSNLTVAADCAVPGGQVCIDLTSIGAGKYCFNSIDLNPADWVGYLACSIAGLGQTIWNAIYSFFTQAILAIVNGLASIAETAVQALLDALLVPIQLLEGLIQQAILALTVAIQGAATQAGPFAPIVTALLVAAVILFGFVVGYVAWFGLIAIGKTIFNLL